jgi:hypothetical protein
LSGKKEKTPVLADWIIGWANSHPDAGHEVIRATVAVGKDGTIVLSDRGGTLLVIQSGCGAFVRRVVDEPADTGPIEVGK